MDEGAVKIKEIIESLEKKDDAKYLLDTCFFVHQFSIGKTKRLVNFCTENVVGMTSFNLYELEHIHHSFDGNMNHHIRDFLKKGILYNVPVSVFPGNKEDEKKYVDSFDDSILSIVPDPSDAVLFVAALKIKADILTRDKHHLFTGMAENYSGKHDIKVLNDFP